MNVGTIYKCADVRPCYKQRKLEVWRKPLSNKESIACISKTGLGGHDGSRERLMRWWPKLSWEKQAHDESWCVYQPRMWRWKVVLIILMVLVLVVAVEFPWNVMPKEKVTRSLLWAHLDVSFYEQNRKRKHLKLAIKSVGDDASLSCSCCWQGRPRIAL